MRVKKLTRELVRRVAEEVRELDTGRKDVERKSEGDYQRDIDNRAIQVATDYLEKKQAEERVLAFGGEGKNWSDASSGKEIDNLSNFKYGILMDFVEGTKNTGKKSPSDVYTTAVLYDIEKKKIISSCCYGWDNREFFYDGETSYLDGEPAEIRQIDEISDTVKIFGVPYLEHVEGYREVAELFIDKFRLNVRDMPMLKSDGTTTSSLIGSAVDRGIDIDPRGLFKKVQRAAFVHDLAPAGSWARNLGVEILTFEGEKFELNPLKDEKVAYIALPPGRVKKKVKELVPKIKEKMRNLENK